MNIYVRRWNKYYIRMGGATECAAAAAPTIASLSSTLFVHAEGNTPKVTTGVNDTLSQGKF